jgi:hypothetical protein
MPGKVDIVEIAKEKKGGRGKKKSYTSGLPM